MALTREEKERIVSEVKEVADKASSLVVSDARGLKVSELSEIRKPVSYTHLTLPTISDV